MDLSRLAQFPVEIEVFKDGGSICARIEDEEAKKRLKKMICQEAVKYAMGFLKKKWSDDQNSKEIKDYIIQQFGIIVYKESRSIKENVSNKRIADHLNCKLNEDTGEVILYCRVSVT